jgi:hypothetical protein
MVCGRSTVKVFASPGSWIESDAVAQCHRVAALELVIADLVQHRLATPIATTVPVVTYKAAESKRSSRTR